MLDDAMVDFGWECQVTGRREGCENFKIIVIVKDIGIVGELKVFRS
jgi:hypothetical protein